MVGSAARADSWSGAPMTKGMRPQSKQGLGCRGSGWLLVRLQKWIRGGQAGVLLLLIPDMHLTFVVL